MKPGHFGFLNQLLEAEQQAAVLRDKVRELELCLDTTRSQLRDKDAHLEEQKRKERDLLTTVTEYACSLSDNKVPSCQLPCYFSE